VIPASSCNDGVERKGFARLVGSKQIKFRSNKKQKGRLFTYKDIEKAKIYYKRGTKTYAFVYLKGKETPKLLELVLTGKIDWYKKIRQRNSGPISSGNGLSFPGISYTVEDSYLRRKKDSVAVHISSDRLFVKNFRKLSIFTMTHVNKKVKQSIRSAVRSLQLRTGIE